MIQLQQVSKIFNEVKAVNNISFLVEENETLVLLGTSGCGKTTTLRMINRLSDPTKGKIVVNGQDILEQQPEELRKGIGYVLQHNGLFPHYTVAENIAIVPQLLKWNKEKIQTRTVELLNKLHLNYDQYANAYPTELSGGQQQRVGLARALAADPPVLLMDEPFGALDPVTRTSIRKEFTQLDEFKKKTIVLVTHDIQEAFELGDRICLMDKGEIIQIGTPNDLLLHPANEFVHSFLQEHKFTLELQTLLIKDIIQLLPQTSDGESLKSIVAETSLLDALKLLSSNNSISYSVKLAKDNSSKKVSTETILSAYSKFKSKQ